jgi:hypothetical protein
VWRIAACAASLTTTIADPAERFPAWLSQLRLGNGNMFCFHRENGSVYYFDHDSEPLLTKFFDDAQTYLNALMLITLAEVHEADERGEALLISKFGEALVRKWMY